MCGEASLGGWQDVPIRVTVVGKIRELIPNQKSALVEVSGAQFVATVDPIVLGTLAVGLDVLIDEEFASIVGTAPATPKNGHQD